MFSTLHRISLLVSLLVVIPSTSVSAPPPLPEIAVTSGHPAEPVYFDGIRIFVISDEATILGNGLKESVVRGSTWTVRAIDGERLLVNGTFGDGYLPRKDVAPLSAAPQFAEKWRTSHPNDAAGDLILGWYWLPSDSSRAAKCFERARGLAENDFQQAWAAFGICLANEVSIRRVEEAKEKHRKEPRVVSSSAPIDEPLPSQLSKDPFQGVSPNSPWTDYLRTIVKARQYRDASGQLLNGSDDVEAERRFIADLEHDLDAILTRFPSFGRAHGWKAWLKFWSLTHGDVDYVQRGGKITVDNTLQPILNALDDCDRLHAESDWVRELHLIMAHIGYSNASEGMKVVAAEKLKRTIETSLEKVPFYRGVLDMACYAACRLPDQGVHETAFRACTVACVAGSFEDQHARNYCKLRDLNSFFKLTPPQDDTLKPMVRFLQLYADGPLAEVKQRYGCLPIRREWAEGVDRVLANFDPERPAGWCREGFFEIAPESRKTHPLHEAMKKGDGLTIAMAVALGADADATNEAGESLLHVAINRTQTGLVYALLAESDVRGQRYVINVNRRSVAGLTPLQAAIKNQDSGTILMLLANGANIGADDLAAARSNGFDGALDSTSIIAEVEAQFVIDCAAQMGKLRKELERIMTRKWLPLPPPPNTIGMGFYEQERVLGQWQREVELAKRQERELTSAQLKTWSSDWRIDQKYYQDVAKLTSERTQAKIGTTLKTARDAVDVYLKTTSADPRP